MSLRRAYSQGLSARRRSGRRRSAQEEGREAGRSAHADASHDAARNSLWAGTCRGRGGGRRVKRRDTARPSVQMPCRLDRGPVSASRTRRSASSERRRIRETARASRPLISRASFSWSAAPISSRRRSACCGASRLPWPGRRRSRSRSASAAGRSPERRPGAEPGVRTRRRGGSAWPRRSASAAAS